MKRIEVFSTDSANHDDRMASYNSDFQRRLEAMNKQSMINYLATQVRVFSNGISALGDIDQAIEEAFA